VTLQPESILPASTLRMHGTLTFSNSIYEKNDETEPEHIHPLTTSLSMDSGELKYTFRHESVTVIELGR